MICNCGTPSCPACHAGSHDVTDTLTRIHAILDELTQPPSEPVWDALDYTGYAITALESDETVAHRLSDALGLLRAAKGVLREDVDSEGSSPGGAPTAQAGETG